jgi:hypothetical protein
MKVEDPMRVIEGKACINTMTINRRTFLVATVGTMLRVRLAAAQSKVLQPVLAEADCPLEIITPTTPDGHTVVSACRGSRLVEALFRQSSTCMVA